MYHTAQVAKTDSLIAMIKTMECAVTSDGQLVFKVPEMGQEVSDPKKLSIINEFNELNFAGSKKPENIKPSEDQTKIEEFANRASEHAGVQVKKLSIVKEMREKT
ncbi:MAG: hypothetical protein BAJALOKI1v1_1300005 [Promethearchaeota archaeon]|nr:MAG: hypothetical protein BAJALOKI1v1_1300005 [Candidatus Lokiarchaeota archaeon]